MTTWQVLAALVAAALPFLFVILPFVRDEALAVTRTAQVLLADTLIYPILLFGLGGIIWTGVAAVWLSADSSVWLGFLLVLLPTVLGVGFAYHAASRIISDPQYVRRQSQQLLLEIIEDAIVEQQSRAYANEELVEILEAEGIANSPLFTEPDDAIPILSRRDGLLRDLDKAGLQAWLEELGQLVPDVPPAAFQTDDTGAAEIVSPSDERRACWKPLIGDQLHVGDPIVMLPSAAAEEVDIDQLAASLDRCLKVS